MVSFGRYVLQLMCISFLLFKKIIWKAFTRLFNVYDLIGRLMCKVYRVTLSFWCKKCSKTSAL